MKRFLFVSTLACFAATLSAQTACPNPYDGNGDGAVTIADLLDLLGLFGDADTDQDGIWDSVDECVDTSACNYVANPTEACAYIDVLGICGGGCEGDGDGDGICDDVDTCVGALDECGVCNGPGPTEIVIDEIVITYDSIYLPVDGEWFVYAVDVDTTFTYTCAPYFGDCGDPVSYQGYDYATVLIGEQCWFAENLRYLPSVGTPSANLGVPNATVCGYIGNNIDAAMSQESYTVYGALYNYSAVADWQLCPSGYHVPSDDDWQILEAHLGMPADEIVSVDDSRGFSVGANDALKSESLLWDIPGNNSTGFGALPGGLTNSNNDICWFQPTGQSNIQWTMLGSSSLDENGEVWVRILHDYEQGMGIGIPRFGASTYQSNGVDNYFSVRCLQN